MIRVEHGGPDGGTPIAHDFSTNANPLGPPPGLATALRELDRRRYPDPRYRALREGLARWLGMAPERVLPTAGTSEAIRRLTLAAMQQGVGSVWLPRPGYGDYASAAGALGLRVCEYAEADELLDGLRAEKAPVLLWLCEPCNPTGRSLPAAFWSALVRVAAQRRLVIALDLAYEPLRLEGMEGTGEVEQAGAVPLALTQQAWQCFSPNKALGLTGVRAGYLVAPAHDTLGLLPRVEALAPSWVLSAEGVALLEVLPHTATHDWLAQSRAQLLRWGQDQREALASLGWQQRPSVTNFWLARPVEQGAALQQRLVRLREQGVKLRDATSFGLPGWVRVSVQPPPSQQALMDAWRDVGRQA